MVLVLYSTNVPSAGEQVWCYRICGLETGGTPEELCQLGHLLPLGDPGGSICGVVG